MPSKIFLLAAALSLPAALSLTFPANMTVDSLHIEVYQSGMYTTDVPPKLASGATWCPKRPFTLFCKGGAENTTVAWQYMGQPLNFAEGDGIAGTDPLNGHPRPWSAFAGTGVVACTAGNETVAVTMQDGCTPSEIPGKTQALVAPNATAVAANSTTSEPVVSDAENSDVITIDPLKDAPGMSEGWTKEAGGIVYKAYGGPEIATTPESGEQFMRLEFVATENGDYGLSMDSTSLNITEYNDVFLRSGEHGFVRQHLEKAGGAWKMVAQEPTMDWLKVYQSAAGRVWQASTSEKKPDSLVLKGLKKGGVYAIDLAGRSSKFSVHGFCLIPCAGKRCSRQTLYWREMEKMCSSS